MLCAPVLRLVVVHWFSYANEALCINKWKDVTYLECETATKGGDTLHAIHALTHAVTAGSNAAFKIWPQPLPKSTTSFVRFSPAIHAEISVVTNVAGGGCTCRRRCYRIRSTF